LHLDALEDKTGDQGKKFRDGEAGKTYMMSDSFPVRFISWEESARLARTLAAHIKGDRSKLPDLVIAIGRGGFVPARVVCDELLTTSLTSIRLEHWGPGARRKERAVVRFPLSCSVADCDLLVIDDVSDTGDTLSVAISYLQELQPSRIRTGVLHHKASSRLNPDYYAELVKDWNWIIYPWALHEDICGFMEIELTSHPVSLPDLHSILLKRYNLHVATDEMVSAVEDLIRLGKVTKKGELLFAYEDGITTSES